MTGLPKQQHQKDMSKIEDYALVSDTQTAALIARDGSVDWLPFPRFDSAACFAALLGDQRNGRWRLAPRGPVLRTRRRYHPGTLVLETEHDTPEGTVRVVDFMPIRGQAPDLVRLVEGVRGRVAMETELVIRFDYGRTVPWVRRRDDALTATAGPDAVCFRGDIDLHPAGLTTRGEAVIAEGERRSLICTWFPSHEPLPEPVAPQVAFVETVRWWEEWSARCTYQGPAREAVLTSLAVLKGLTFGPTGGIVAAPSTSLPERIGGVRNWDYRYCWLRDATLTLYALLLGGHGDEAVAWREWLLRAAAGDPGRLQIMYGVAGEARLPEMELPWLPGYAGSRPVRIGNAAHGQLQLDVYGELLDCFYEARRAGIAPGSWAWALEKALLEALERRWREPDHGIWESRGPLRHFTHSKVMAWVAFDRAVKSAERLGLEGPVERWRALRREIHEEVCRCGYDRSRNAFTQSYGGSELDASLLMIPLVGFLPPQDPRAVGTVEAIERDLTEEGLVIRYRTESPGADDGLPPGDGAFLPCSFWLVDALVLLGRRERASRLFERLLRLRNDVGLLSEEYAPSERRFLGNFPQAFTHLALVNSAFNLAGHPGGAARQRGER
jgi:GH15 family glucan-1,4-alpha-glucosidase